MIHENLQDELTLVANDSTYWQISKEVIESLHRFVFHRIETGGFLRAVLANDLFEALSRADSGNRARLFPIVTYIYMRLPKVCYGSDEAVESWLRNEPF